MPALAATRYNPDLRAKYRQLGKLLVLANALLDQDRCWSLHDRGLRGGPGVATR